MVRQMFLEEQYTTVDRGDEEVAYIDYDPDSLVKNLTAIRDLNAVEK